MLAALLLEHVEELRAAQVAGVPPPGRPLQTTIVGNHGHLLRDGCMVQDFLDQPSVDRVVSESEENGDKLLTLGRLMQAETHAVVSVTTVRLMHYGESWIVVGATDPQSLLSFASPSPGATIETPLTVTGPAFGVDEAAKIDVSMLDCQGIHLPRFGDSTEPLKGVLA